MLLGKAKQLVAACYKDQRLLDLYAKGDRLSSNQTKHDIAHAIEVLDVAIELTAKIHAQNPSLLDEWDREVIIPLAAFLHDIGRAIDVDNHDKAGAKWANEFLKELTLPGDNEILPLNVRNRVVRIIACHRAHRYRNVKFVDTALDIVLIADKCVGDEERVRPGRASVLRILTALRLAWIPLRKGSIHDRANFAIKGKPRLEMDDDAFVLRLTIDTRVCKPSLIYNLYGDRFYCCELAFAKIGYLFQLEFNGVRYWSCGKEGDWHPE
jgi:hypothetical protein